MSPEVCSSGCREHSETGQRLASFLSFSCHYRVITVFGESPLVSIKSAQTEAETRPRPFGGKKRGLSTGLAAQTAPERYGATGCN